MKPYVLIAEDESAGTLTGGRDRSTSLPSSSSSPSNVGAHQYSDDVHGCREDPSPIAESGSRDPTRWIRLTLEEGRLK